MNQNQNQDKVSTNLSGDSYCYKVFELINETRPDLVEEAGTRGNIIVTSIDYDKLGYKLQIAIVGMRQVLLNGADVYTINEPDVVSRFSYDKHRRFISFTLCLNKETKMVNIYNIPDPL